MTAIKEVEIDGDFITLGQFIKVVNLVSSGGEAKAFLNNNKATINKENDNRRGRKLYKGDNVIIKGNQYKIC